MITSDTREYEQWLGTQLTLVPADIERKHAQMTLGVFPFMRATFYRWLRHWKQACTELEDAAVVLAVGDLHLENFGTWRDTEGRLVWGVNDFDEAVELPWPQDLVRLATSALLATKSDKLGIAPEVACSAILEGYLSGVTDGGRSFVLAERHRWLRKIALGKLRDPALFWEKFDQIPTVEEAVPMDAAQALQHLMPEPGIETRVVHRVAGLGSLGRRRYVALSNWRGGKLAREAKAIAPSAWYWSERIEAAGVQHCQTLLDSPTRAADPFVSVQGGFIVRRLAPDCARIELKDLPTLRDECRLLRAMGYETANVHLGTDGTRAKLLADPRLQKSEWLLRAAKRTAKLVIQDFREFREAIAKGEMRVR